MLGGIFPQIGTKLHIIDHEQGLYYVCTSLLFVLWSSGQIKPPGEGGGGGFRGQGEESGGALEGMERGD